MNLFNTSLQSPTPLKLVSYSVIGLLGLSACQKETDVLVDANRSSEVNVTPRVKAFVDRASHHDSQGARETLSTDSAIWYLEAAANYSAAQPWKEHTTISSDSLMLSFDFSSGTVPESMVYDAYAQLIATVASYTNSQQHLYMVDVVETSEQLNTGELLVICLVASGYEKAYNNPPNTYYPPGYQAYYKYPPPTYCSGSTSHGAHEIIRDRINSANVISIQPGQYLHSVETWTVHFLPTDIPSRIVHWKDSFMDSSTPSNNGYHETLLYSWAHNSPVGSPCLDSSEMTYWTGSTWNGINKIRQTYCPSKYFVQCIMAAGDFFDIDGTGPMYGVHLTQASYGLIGNPSS